MPPEITPAMLETMNSSATRMKATPSHRHIWNGSKNGFGLSIIVQAALRQALRQHSTFHTKMQNVSTPVHVMVTETPFSIASVMLSPGMARSSEETSQSSRLTFLVKNNATTANTVQMPEKNANSRLYAMPLASVPPLRLAKRLTTLPGNESFQNATAWSMSANARVMMLLMVPL